MNYHRLHDHAFSQGFAARFTRAPYLSVLPLYTTVRTELHIGIRCLTRYLESGLERFTPEPLRHPTAGFLEVVR
jgi:hypothetical protein